MWNTSTKQFSWVWVHYVYKRVSMQYILTTSLVYRINISKLKKQKALHIKQENVSFIKFYVVLVVNGRDKHLVTEWETNLLNRYQFVYCCENSTEKNEKKKVGNNYYYARKKLLYIFNSSVNITNYKQKQKDAVGDTDVKFWG